MYIYIYINIIFFIYMNIINRNFQTTSRLTMDWVLPYNKLANIRYIDVYIYIYVYMYVYMHTYNGLGFALENCVCENQGSQWTGLTMDFLPYNKMANIRYIYNIYIYIYIRCAYGFVTGLVR